MTIVYISVDIEASGPYPPDYSMLSIGAAVVGNFAETYYVELKPISENFTKEALEVAGFTIDGAKERGKDIIAAMTEFAHWIEKQIQASGKRSMVKFVGYPAGFDWMFVNYYFLKFFGSNPFGLAPIDIRSVYFGLFSEDNGFTVRKEDMKRRLGVIERHTHNALDDAIEQGQIFARMLEVRRSRTKMA